MLFNVLDYGAVNDGLTASTAFIQKAIDACESAGGGKVVVPAGNFVTGTLYLKDNVELHLESGSKLIASTDLSDYNDVDLYPQNSSSENELWWGKHLILALEKTNVSVTGFGEIDGRAEFFYQKPKKYPFMTGYLWKDGFASAKDKEKRRPGQLICFIECKHVRVQDITVKNATCWSCFLHGSEYVQVRGIKVFNHKCHANTDGIDIDCCRFVTISDCIIDTGDDAIAVRCNSLKLKNPKPCEYVTITNCSFSVSVCGIRFGVGQGIIRNVRVSNITMERAGVPFLLQTRYGKSCLAHISDIGISGVNCADAGYPFRILGPVGSIKRVSISDMRIKGVASVKIIAEGECEIKDIAIKDVDIYLSNEPEGTIFTTEKLLERGSYAIEIENTEGVTLENVRVISDKLVGWDGNFKEKNNVKLNVKNCDL